MNQLNGIQIGFLQESLNTLNVHYANPQRRLESRILQYLTAESKKPLGEYKNSYEKIEVVDDNINVTVKNTSNVSWDILNEVRLGIIYNGNDIGKRVNLPVGKTITPGEIYTFVVPKSLIAGLDRNRVEFLMLQEGISYFEEKCGMTK